MPKLQICSDLHIEFGDLMLPGGDILILSGDVCEAGSYGSAKYPQVARFFEEECSKKYQHVIYCAGNHEHYGMVFQKTADYLRNRLPSNVHLLERETFDIDDIVFVGTTLWTDMNGEDWHTMYAASQYMSDYRYITMFNKSKNAYHKLIPEFTVQEHLRSRDFIKQTVESDPNKKYVVVTHHAPSKLSTHPVYAHDVLMNGAYHSDLSEFILDHPQIKLWTHGHTHTVFDYTIGETRIVCNPRGYAGHEQRSVDFNAKEFEITL